MNLPKGVRRVERPVQASSVAQEANAQPKRPYDPFLLLLEAEGLPVPETEARFAPARKYKADYLWREQWLIVEREGGLWSHSEQAQSAHARPLAILRDMERLNLAQQLGFRYLRFTPEQLDRGAALPLIRELLERGSE